MIGKVLLLSLVFVSLILESTLFSFPFVLVFSLLYLFYFDDVLGLILVFIFSLFLDSFLLQQLGTTALFVFMPVLIYIALEKIFSLQGPILFASVLAACVFVYGTILGYPFSLVLSGMLALGLVIFIIFERRRERKGGMLA